jgi:hypothetical protein
MGEKDAFIVVGDELPIFKPLSSFTPVNTDHDGHGGNGGGDSKYSETDSRDAQPRITQG